MSFPVVVTERERARGRRAVRLEFLREHADEALLTACWFAGLVALAVWP